MRRPLKKWTPQEDERLAALWARGVSGPEIAAALDRSVAGAYSRAALLGLGRRVKKIDIDRIEELKKSGLTHKEISTITGYSVQRIWHYLKMAGFASDRPARPKSRRMPDARIKSLKNRKTKRACLKCDKDFMSEGPHNRLCPACRESNAFICDAPVQVL